MKYVIVSVVRGDAGELNEKLRREVKENFGIKSSTLPAHFTIKAPFDYRGSVEELKEELRNFVNEKQAKPYRVRGYDHFERRVIFMDIQMSDEAKKVHDDLMDLLESFPYIQCNENDGKDKRFHLTVASKKIGLVFDQIWEDVQQISCDFECLFDNICLYHLGESKWEMEGCFVLKT